MASRKRARADVEADANPFTIEYPNTNADKKSKKRRRDDSAVTKQTSEIQESPFAPRGQFKDPGHKMDRHYKVLPTEEWNEMIRYNSFVINGVRYSKGSCVFVANSSTIHMSRNPAQVLRATDKSQEDWVAHILEIKAKDADHVYARVYWMYWPDELPDRSVYHGRLVKGRQPYHGINEVVASNHMDIINVISVTSPATVEQWDERNEDDVQRALYWRQALDVCTMELSSVLERCICKEPENPDKVLISCSNEKCGIWLHADCLAQKCLMATWERLGPFKPHIAVKQEQVAHSPGRTAVSGQAFVDIKTEKGVNSQSTYYAVRRGDLASLSAVPKKSRGRPKKPSSSDEEEPYEFTAVIINDPENPAVIEITDLRDVGGESSWRETLKCLGCGETIQ